MALNIQQENLSLILIGNNAFTTALTGDQIVSSNFGVKSGTVDIPDSMTKSFFRILSVGDSFNYSDKMDFNIVLITLPVLVL